MHRLRVVVPLLLLASTLDAQDHRGPETLASFRSNDELSRYLRALVPPPPPRPAAVPCVNQGDSVSRGPLAGGVARGAVITGRVRNPGGEALRMSRISLGAGQVVASDSAGEFRFHVPADSLAAADSVTVTARRIGFTPRSRRVPVKAGDSVHVEFRLCGAIVELEAAVMTATSASVAGESITNVQHEGVDEGGIVKLHGDHLVILRRGRLFTVALGDRSMRPVAQVDAYPPGMEGESAWYDEMLVYGDVIVVVGYSYRSRGTEINLFRISDTGGLRYLSTYHLRSNDYYSSRNYASRLIGQKLVFYTPTYLYAGTSDPLQAIPALRRWRGTKDTVAFAPIATPRQVYAISRETATPRPTALHTVTSCDLAREPLECEATVVVGPPGRVFYVSSSAVYVWTSEMTHPSAVASTDAVVYRMPLDGSSPQAVRVSGGPIDQFSFLEGNDRHLNVLVQAEGRGESMWSAERTASRLALLRIPLRSFGDGSHVVPANRYRPLPGAGRGALHNRFVGTRLVYGFASPGSDSAGSVVAVVPLDGSRMTQHALVHGLERIEPMGRDALVVGSREDALHLGVVRLDHAPGPVHDLRLAGLTQGEDRSHAFFYRPDGPNDGMLGLPIRRSGSSRYAQLDEESASVLYVRNDARRLMELGRLDAQQRLVDDGCQASCVDWYGNSRPLFIRGRVFALLGYELVEGAIRDGRVVETGRVTFASEKATADRIRASQDSVEILRLLEREVKGIALGMRDSVMLHYDRDFRLSAAGKTDRYYWNLARDPGVANGGSPREPARTLHVEELLVSGDLAVMRLTWVTDAARTDERPRVTRELRVWRRNAGGRWMVARAVEH